MKTLSLSLALAGIFILFILLFSQAAMTITSEKNLSSLEKNQKVLLAGKIISEKTYEKTKIFILDSNITLVCNSCPSLKNKSISAEGVIEEYRNKKQVKISKINFILSD